MLMKLLLLPSLVCVCFNALTTEQQEQKTSTENVTVLVSTVASRSKEFNSDLMAPGKLLPVFVPSPTLGSRFGGDNKKKEKARGQANSSRGIGSNTAFVILALYSM